MNKKQKGWFYHTNLVYGDTAVLTTMGFHLFSSNFSFDSTYELVVEASSP